MLVEVVEYLLRVPLTFQFDDKAHTFSIGFIADFGDAIYSLVFDQLGDSLYEGCFVGLIRQLGNDYLVSSALGGLFDVRLGCDYHSAVSGAVGALYPLSSLEDAACGEIGSWYKLDEVVNCGIGIVDKVTDSIAKLAEVVRGYIGCHAYGYAGGAVKEQIGQPRGENHRLFEAAIEVGGEV